MRIEERKIIKSKILNTKSKRIQERLQKECSSKDKEMKRSARQDKRAYVDKLAEKAKTASQKGELSTVYRITKQLCRHTNVAASIVKDKDGNALTTEHMQVKRWAENFIEVLNTEAPTITAGPPAPNNDLDIATGVPTLQEVTHAIKQMKTGKSGVRQGCILSPILFNITLDYIMRQTTQNARHGIQWTMFSQLEDLGYADVIALFSTNARHLQQKANVLNENAKKAGLHITVKKTKVMHLNLTEPHPQIMIDGEELGAVDDFTYLGSNISADNSVQKDISARINKARNSYCSIRNIWKSNIYSLKTKLRLFNSNVISVLLYGCQSWRVSKDDMNKLDVFQTKCLRRNCNIFWQYKISNEDLYRRTNSSPTSR